jgi:hypothetical protein
MTPEELFNAALGLGKRVSERRFDQTLSTN